MPNDNSVKCYECGGHYTETTGEYVFSDTVAGPISVTGLPYFRCEKCSDILFPPEISEHIGKERELIIHETISSYPVKAFVTASEAATMLGITRQAFHKNRRIKRGFIFQTSLGDLTVYVRQSVEKFKDTGDGRFPLFMGTTVTQKPTGRALAASSRA